VLNRYRDLSAWDDVIRFFQSLPPEIANSPHVVPTVALAFTRRDQPERAIELLQQHIDSTGGDPESEGLLGSIYKKRFGAHRRPEDLHAAVEHYEKGFAGDPQNLYLGRSLAWLLHMGGFETKLAQLLPEVRALAEFRIHAAPTPDYWDCEASLILSVIARDWPAAHQQMSMLLDMQPRPWMFETIQSELESLADAGMSSADLIQIHALVDQAHQLATGEEEEEDA